MPKTIPLSFVKIKVPIGLMEFKERSLSPTYEAYKYGMKALSVNKCWSDKLLALRLARIGVYELSYGIVNPRFVDARARLKGENL
jgi:hypothetical protein